MAPTRVGSHLTLVRVCYGVTALLIAATWWVNVHNVDLVIALRGFSPIAWVYKTHAPADFANDFPGGVENLRHSAFMHVYPVAYRLFGIPPEGLLPAIVAVEIVSVAIAIWVLTRTLVPAAAPIVPALVVALAIASWARHISFSMNRAPAFLGQYQTFADCLRFLGIAFALRRKFVGAAVLLAAAFTVHPMLGGTALLCVVIMHLLGWKELPRGQVLLAGLAFVVIAGGWAAFQLASATVSSGRIPVEEWLALTRAFSFHWYPVQNGLFSTRPSVVLLPFLGFLILLAHYSSRDTEPEEAARKARIGIGAMLSVAGLGVAISAWSSNPFLIKLALHRATDLVVILGLPFVVTGLWDDIRNGNRWQQILATLALLGPFVLWERYPVLIAIALASPTAGRFLSGVRSSVLARVTTVLVAATAALVIFYGVTGFARDFVPLSVIGGRRGLFIGAVLLIAMSILAIARRTRLFPAVVSTLAVIAVGVWLWSEATSPLEVKLARDYKDVQLWARTYTRAAAVFMPDPTIYYGWRDYSRRSSFGNLREWLEMSWMYNSDDRLYREGMRRFGEFEVPLKPYLEFSPAQNGSWALTDTVRSAFYRMDDSKLRELANRYGIDYFVMKRQHQVTGHRLPIVFQNDSFVVYAGERTSQARR